MSNSSSFLIYTASAGSGKTFTLVKEYLIKLFTASGNDGFKQILAITFTNKAVAEMKSRIIDALVLIANYESEEGPEPIIFELRSTLGFTEQHLKSKAQSILISLLHNYAAFSVETIDSFNHRLIRTFAKDLGLNTNFEVTLDTKILLAQAVDRFVSKAGVDDRITKILVDFALSKTEEDKSWDITYQLNDVAKLLISEPHFKNLSSLLAKDDAQWEALKELLEKRDLALSKNITQISADFFELLKEQALAFNDFSGSSIPKHFVMVKDKRLDINWNTVMRSKIEEASFYNKTQTDDKKATIDAIRPEIERLFTTSRDLLFEYSFNKSLLQGLVPLSVLRGINDEFEALKEELNLVTINEFNRRIANQIKDQPAPFIYERLGDRYRHFFIDEFQDTSQMQWTNLLPLVDNALAQQYTDSSTGSLMIVGDAKQAIYRWRGGASEQFIDLYGGETPFSVGVSTQTLDTNYRSYSEIISFNNQFFSYAAQYLSKQSYKELYLDGNAQKSTPKEGGFVKLSFVEGSNKDEQREAIAPKVTQIIDDCLARGYNLKDICILTRRKEESMFLANFLKEKEVLVQSTDSVLVANSDLVNFVVNMMRWLANKDNDEAAFEVLRYVYSLSAHKVEMHDYIKANLRVSPQQIEKQWQNDGFEFSFAIIQQKELYEATEYLVQAFRLHKKVDPFLRAMLEHIYNFEQKNDSSLTGFLEYWDEKKEDLGIALSQEIDAIKIMTVHSSKGLQFKVVIFPFANAKFDDVNKDNLWLPLDAQKYAGFDNYLMRSSTKMDQFSEAIKQVRERHKEQVFFDELNVLYVSLTRAVGELYVIGKTEKPSAKTYSSLLIDYLQYLGLWDPSKDSYEFGEPLRILKKDTANKVEAILEDTYLSTPKQQHELSLVSTLDREDAVHLLAKQRGIRIHHWLSQIITKDDIEGLFFKQGSLSQYKANVLKEDEQLVLAIVNHPKLSPYFEEGVTAKNEIELIDANGNLLRPDRLNFESNTKVTIIDYKIGHPDPSYRTQLDCYEIGLRDLGYDDIEKILVYYQEDITIDSW